MEIPIVNKAVLPKTTNYIQNIIEARTNLAEVSLYCSFVSELFYYWILLWIYIVARYGANHTFWDWKHLLTGNPSRIEHQKRVELGHTTTKSHIFYLKDYKVDQRRRAPCKVPPTVHTVSGDFFWQAHSLPRNVFHPLCSSFPIFVGTTPYLRRIMRSFSTKRGSL